MIGADGIHARVRELFFGFVTLNENGAHLRAHWQN